jgi:glucose-1-phosphate thymidylyltransferase
MKMRGVILAGGKGTRLGDLSRVTNKHLLPVGSQPMVYHPLMKLVGAGVRDVLLVSGPEDLGAFVALLGSGSRHGCELTYRAQDEAGGVAQALGLAADFCRDAQTVVLLGDNVFEDPLGPLLERAAGAPEHAWLTLKCVDDPARYGVAELQEGRVVDLEEKPERPRSNLAVVGIYVYPPGVFELIRGLRPSRRGEFEITDVNRRYLEQGRLLHCLLDGYWTDAGTLESLQLANELVRSRPPQY